MKLYMRQKIFSIKDKFIIKDADGADKYFVEGKLISVGKKLTVFDKEQNEIALVKQKVVSLLPKFIVEIGGEEVATISKKFTILKHKYIIDGPNWEVQGDMLGHDYSIIENGVPVAIIHKKWMSFGDSFEVDIPDETKEILAISVVLAIDFALDRGDNT